MRNMVIRMLFWGADHVSGLRRELNTGHVSKREQASKQLFEGAGRPGMWEQEVSNFRAEGRGSAKSRRWVDRMI